MASTILEMYFPQITYNNLIKIALTTKDEKSFENHMENFIEDHMYFPYLDTLYGETMEKIAKLIITEKISYDVLSILPKIIQAEVKYMVHLISYIQRRTTPYEDLFCYCDYCDC